LFLRLAEQDLVPRVVNDRLGQSAVRGENTSVEHESMSKALGKLVKNIPNARNLCSNGKAIRCPPFYRFWRRCSCQQYKSVQCCHGNANIEFRLHHCRATQYFLKLLTMISTKSYECVSEFLPLSSSMPHIIGTCGLSGSTMVLHIFS